MPRGKCAHNAHARSHMGTTRSGTYTAGDAATPATAAEAPPPQVTPPPAAAAGGDSASQMDAAAMVNAVNAHDDDVYYSSSSSDEEDETDNRPLDGSVKIARAERSKYHVRNQVALPAGTPVNVTRINAFCSNDENPLWEHIGYTEVPPLPHTATNRFKISDDIGKTYADIVARAKDLAVSKPADAGGDRIFAFYCDPATVEAEGCTILRPPPNSGHLCNVVAFSKQDVSTMRSQGYTVDSVAGAVYHPSADASTVAGADLVEEGEVEIGRERQHLPQVKNGEWNKLVEAWEDGYSVGNKSFSPLRMWTKDARKKAWAELPNERGYFSTRLGSLAAMYWAVTHCKPEEMPKGTKDAEKRGAALLKSESGSASDVAAEYANAAVLRRGREQASK